MTLRPDGGGAIVATSVIAAQGGVALNNTLLTEELILYLLVQNSDTRALATQLAAQLAIFSQMANLSDEVAEYASLAPVQLIGPPECGPPGGDRLQYVNGSWICVCNTGWTKYDGSGSCVVTQQQLYGTASQIATFYSVGDYPDQVASLANDNISTCDNPQGVGVSITPASSANGPNNWWQLDLGAPRTISKLVLIGRSSSHSSQYSNIQVYVSSVPSIVGQAARLENASACASGVGLVNPQGLVPSNYVICPFLVGRYVLVYQLNYDFLSLCEVNVFGYDTTPATAVASSTSAPLVTTISALATQLAVLQATVSGVNAQANQLATSLPPACMPPGGDRLLYNGTAWVCVCVPSWSGLTCSQPPSPPPSPLPSPPPSPQPPPSGGLFPGTNLTLSTTGAHFGGCAVWGLTVSSLNASAVTSASCAISNPLYMNIGGNIDFTTMFNTTAMCGGSGQFSVTYLTLMQQGSNPTPDGLTFGFVDASNSWQHHHRLDVVRCDELGVCSQFCL